jgi:hypothetical protein
MLPVSSVGPASIDRFEAGFTIKLVSLGLSFVGSYLTTNLTKFT